MYVMSFSGAERLYRITLWVRRKVKEKEIRKDEGWREKERGRERRRKERERLRPTEKNSEHVSLQVSAKAKKRVR